MTKCIELSNKFIEISNNEYIFDFNINNQDENYGIFETSNNFYKFINIPINNPITFFSQQSEPDLSNNLNQIINFYSGITDPIKIYVSSGNNISYTNGDFFRFYDESFNLINLINFNNLNNGFIDANASGDNFELYDQSSNFYFMKGISYEFIATTDFSSNHPFCISGNLINSSELSLNESDDEFTLYIGNDIDNDNNKIFYQNTSYPELSGNLNILVDSSGLNYYYNNVKLEILNRYATDFSHILLSIKTFLSKDISNIDLLRYSEACEYIIRGSTEYFQLLNDLDPPKIAECLNSVSQAKITYTNNTVLYEFNSGQHSESHEPDLSNTDFSNINYGIFDGSYIIFNIDENYPITLDNITISNDIYINENYSNTTVIDKTDSRIAQLSDIDYSIYKQYNYYYGAIQLIIDSSNQLNVNDSSVNIYILDLSTKIPHIVPNKFIYTNYCAEPETTNFVTLTDDKEQFYLFNQKDVSFAITPDNLASYNDTSDNIYILNRNEEYVEPRIPYVITDKYGHDISNLIVSNAPNSLQKIKEITQDYLLNEFYITYTAIDYQGEPHQLFRKVKIHKGPVFKFDNIARFFEGDNDNTYRDIQLEISDNLYDFPINFLLDISSYIYTISNDILHLPYSISLSGSYYINETLETFDADILTYDIVNYGNINLTTIIDTSNKKHYFSPYKNINYSLRRGLDSELLNTVIGINIKDISSMNLSAPNLPSNLTIEDLSDSILSDIGYLKVNGTDISVNAHLIANNLAIDTSNINNITSINKLRLLSRSQSIDISNIDNSTNTLTFSISDKYIYTIKLTNKNFNIYIEDLSANINDLNIDGSFNPIQIFDIDTYTEPENDIINLNYIGKYYLTFTTLGLGNDDYIYNQNFSDIVGLERAHSRTITIKVRDQTPPTISFENWESPGERAGSFYTYNYPIKAETFNALTNIEFYNLANSPLPPATSTKPRIVYSDNSIYDLSKTNLDISINATGNTSISVNDNNISYNLNLGTDSSINIIYTFYDLSNVLYANNPSTPITLSLVFKNIPVIELKDSSDNNILEVFDTSYNDPGFYLDNSYIELDISFNNLTVYDTDFSLNYPRPSFNIKITTDLCFNVVGNYKITYTVNYLGETDENYIIRYIDIHDSTLPYFLINDLSINDSNTDMIDFSLVVLEDSFNTLKNRLEDFDICDNYLSFANGDLSYSIIYLNNEISYNIVDPSFLNYLIDASYIDNSLNQKFHRVTTGIDLSHNLSSLTFKYQVFDLCYNPLIVDNSFEFIRTVNIIDNGKPEIVFDLNIYPYIQGLIDNSLVMYSNNYVDFSYQAFNKDVSNTYSFVQEISNILFTFDISDAYDNYWTNNNIEPFRSIQNNYTITLNYGDFSTNVTHAMLSDISNDISNVNADAIVNAFKDIGVSFELIYDFSDNQSNDFSYVRNVSIINTILPLPPSLSDGSSIEISFADLSFDYLSYFVGIATKHSRLNSTDISFELSYNILGDTANKYDTFRPSTGIYDQSAIIYAFDDTNTNNFADFSINFFIINTFNVNSVPETLSSEPSVPIQISTINNGADISNSETGTITAEAGYPISDASLIFNIAAYSEFDRFYYNFLITDFSYARTPIDISSIIDVSNPSNPLDQNSPVVGTYTIKYYAKDKNNVITYFDRFLYITDTQAPIITLRDSSTIILLNNELYIEPGVTFEDIGSGLKQITIEISNNSTSNPVYTMYDISNFEITPNQNTFIDADNLLRVHISNSNSISEYTIKYTAYDESDISASKTRTITISIEELIIFPYIIIADPNGTVTKNLTQDFSINKLTHPNLSSDISLSFNNSNPKIITYEATTTNIFKMVTFGASATYYISASDERIEISNSNIMTTNNIISNAMNTYQIIFQAINLEPFGIITEIINFKVIDTTAPTLSFIHTTNYANIEVLEIPLLSNVNTYVDLSNNIDFFNNKNLETEYSKLFTHDANEKIIYALPGLDITDITSGTTKSLVNEMIDEGFQNIFSLEIKYFHAEKNENALNTYSKITELSNIDLSNHGLINYTIDHNAIIADTSNIFIQEYHVYDNEGNRGDISRVLIIKKLPPFINLEYEKDANENIYKKYYHQQFYQMKFTVQSLKAYVFDYYNGAIDITNINDIIHKNIDENTLGLQDLIYKYTKFDTVDVSNSIEIARKVHIIELHCLDTKNSNIIELLNECHANPDHKLGVYNYDYTFNISSPDNAMRIFGYNETTNAIVDISNLIEISGAQFVSHQIYNEDLIHLNGSNSLVANYYYGNFTLFIKNNIDTSNNFNRVSVEFLDSSNGSASKVIFDAILFDENCQIYELNNISDDLSHNPFEQSFNLDVSNINQSISAITESYYIVDNIRQETLHLSIGKYRFNQSFKRNELQTGFRNFYNPIHFSLIFDGPHNTDFATYPRARKEYEYTKNIRRTGLPGLFNSFTEIMIDATTPTHFYYYSKNIPNMGGEIYIKNNYIFYKNVISLNGNILSVDNSNAFATYTANGEDITNKIFLSQRFDISNNFERRNADFIGITQQNLTHNIIINDNTSDNASFQLNTLKNKIVFKKHQTKLETSTNPDDISNNYIIKEDNSNNYLTDISFESNFSSHKSNILYYDYRIDTSSNLLANTSNVQYQLDMADVFYTNNELNTYYDFFVKNKLLNNQNASSTSPNQNINIYLDNFIYKINELNYVNPIQLLNAGVNQDFYEDTYLSNSRLIFNNIFDNLITFNLQTYLSMEKLQFPTSYKNYLFKNIFNNDILSEYLDYKPNYPIDPSNLFFTEYTVQIHSDICGSLAPTLVPRNQALNFANGNIELYGNLLDSSYTSDLLLQIYDDVSINEGIGEVYERLQNRIFLSIAAAAPNGSISGECIGLTMQNIYHNMYLDQDGKFIFYKYNDVESANYQVNHDGLTYEKTLSEISNNKLYLIELSANDIFNCFIDICKNIYLDNTSITGISNDSIVSKNNKFTEYSNQLDYLKGYQTHINTIIQDELDNADNYLIDFNIRSRPLNDISYSQYPYVYDELAQTYHSHSYLINFNDYIDRNFYSNFEIFKIPHNIINYSNIYYKLTDISYIKPKFNIIDVASGFNIIYDKEKIRALNNIQSLIPTLYFKLIYVITYYNYQKTQNSKISIDSNTFALIGNLNIQNVNKLFKETNFVTNTYEAIVENNSLNQLYSNVFYNSKQLITKYNELFASYTYALNYITINETNYDDIYDDDLIDKLSTDISLINQNLDNFYANQKFFRTTILPSSSDFVLASDFNYQHFNIITRLIKQFNEINNKHSQIIFEFNLRHTNKLVEHVYYRNLYEIDNFKEFYISLIRNIIEQNEHLIYNTKIYNKRYANLNNDTSFNITISGDIIDFSNGIFNYPNVDVISLTDDISGTITDLSNQYSFINTKYERLYNGINERYNIASKMTLFDKINYVFNGNDLLINSYQSNNIVFKLEIFYNSYLFPNKYLDTIILDVAIPDYTPPTIIFNNTDLSFNKILSSNANIEELIEILINDISYMEINENQLQTASSIIELSYVEYFYKDVLIYDAPLTNVPKVYSQIIIDISSVYASINGLFSERNITYTVIDNANNVNIITRKVVVHNIFDSAEFFYFNQDTSTYDKIIDLNTFDNNFLTIDEGESDFAIIAKAKERVIVYDVGNTNELLAFNIDISVDLSNGYNENFNSDISFIIYKAVSKINLTGPTIAIRFLKVITAVKPTICCYPKIYYKAIQHNYKMGASNSAAMRMAKIMINHTNF